MAKVTMSQAHRDWSHKPRSDSRNSIIASNAVISLEGGTVFITKASITAAHTVRKHLHNGKVIHVRKVHNKHNVWFGFTT